MLHRDYDGQVCSVARSLEVIGERWTLLIIRDAYLGLTRFDQFHESLGLSRNVLAARLQRLCDEGVLEQRLYQERPKRYEYHLTRKGMDLVPVIAMLVQWGDRYYAPYGPPRLLVHRGCNGDVTANLACAECGEHLTGDDIVTRAGPGARENRQAAAA